MLPAELVSRVLLALLDATFALVERNETPGTRSRPVELRSVSIGYSPETMPMYLYEAWREEQVALLKGFVGVREVCTQWRDVFDHLGPRKVFYRLLLKNFSHFAAPNVRSWLPRQPYALAFFPLLFEEAVKPLWRLDAFVLYLRASGGAPTDELRALLTLLRPWLVSPAADGPDPRYNRNNQYGRRTPYAELLEHAPPWVLHELGPQAPLPAADYMEEGGLRLMEATDRNVRRRDRARVQKAAARFHGHLGTLLKWDLREPEETLRDAIYTDNWEALEQLLVRYKDAFLAIAPSYLQDNAFVRGTPAIWLWFGAYADLAKKWDRLAYAVSKEGGEPRLRLLLDTFPDRRVRRVHDNALQGDGILDALMERGWKLPRRPTQALKTIVKARASQHFARRAPEFRKLKARYGRWPLLEEKKEQKWVDRQLRLIDRAAAAAPEPAQEHGDA